MLWYCVATEGARFEPEAEGGLIRTVADRLPTLVVLTKSYDPGERALQATSSKGLALPVKAVLPVLAEPRYGLPTHGLEQLVDTTAESVPEGVRRAFLGAQVLEVDAKLELALVRVDELVEAQDDSFRLFAFMRGKAGRGAAGEELGLMRVLEAVAQVGAVFGTSSVTDDQVAALARAMLGGATGQAAPAQLLAPRQRSAVGRPADRPDRPDQVRRQARRGDRRGDGRQRRGHARAPPGEARQPQPGPRRRARVRRRRARRPARRDAVRRSMAERFER